MHLRVRILFLFIGLSPSLALAENTIDRAPELRDIYYGEAIYYALQNRHYEAISRLDAELGQYYSLDDPSLDSLNHHIGHAEFSVGSFELAYRMHQRAGRAIKSIMESTEDQQLRNEAAYRLAKIYYQKNQPLNAFDILEKIQGDMPSELKVDEIYFRAQVYIATGKFNEAVTLLTGIIGEEKFEGYADYNLGIAYIQSGEEKKGIATLEKVGKLSSDDKTLLALRDRANLILANRMMENGAPAQAKNYFNRVRLEGPYANRALLGAGWVSASLGEFKKALVPWRILEKRGITDESVQEALLAVPYAYGQLSYYGQAALAYGKAMENIASEIDRLETSIKSVREGRFLRAVLDKRAERDPDWLHNLRDLPDTPETRYLLSLMASHDFYQSLKNYHDLAELKEALNHWLQSLDVYVELIELRRRYYEPLLPVVEEQFKTLDRRIRLRMEQRDRLDQRLKSIVIAPRPEYLATAEERGTLDYLKKIETYLGSHPQYKTDENIERINRLKGVVEWQVNENYHQRLTRAYKEMQTLDTYINSLNQSYQSFIRTRQAATQSYEGYDIPIRQLKTRIQAMQFKVDGVMARQGRMIEMMAVNELERRRNQLEEYQVKARFALAESYDRATKKQEKAAEQKILDEQAKQQSLQTPVVEGEAPIELSLPEAPPQEQAE